MNEREIQVPVAPDRWVVIRAEFPLREVEWARLLTVLNAMKPGLVQPRGEPVLEVHI